MPLKVELVSLTAIDFPVPLSPIMRTPPMRGSTTLRSKASFISSCPATLTKGRGGIRLAFPCWTSSRTAADTTRPWALSSACLFLCWYRLCRYCCLNRSRAGLVGRVADDVEGGESQSRDWCEAVCILRSNCNYWRRDLRRNCLCPRGPRLRIQDLLFTLQ